MRNAHVGSTLESFLHEDGNFVGATRKARAAVKRYSNGLTADDSRERLRGRRFGERRGSLRLMARSEGYVMVRRKGCAPVLMTEAAWLALPTSDQK